MDIEEVNVEFSKFPALFAERIIHNTFKAYTPGFVDNLEIFIA